jgi:hypothetical protein
MTVRRIFVRQVADGHDGAKGRKMTAAVTPRRAAITVLAGPLALPLSQP